LQIFQICFREKERKKEAFIRNLLSNKQFFFRYVLIVGAKNESPRRNAVSHFNFNADPLFKPFEARSALTLRLQENKKCSFKFPKAKYTNKQLRVSGIGF
jgi:hypothetical protein